MKHTNNPSASNVKIGENGCNIARTWQRIPFAMETYHQRKTRPRETCRYTASGGPRASNSREKRGSWRSGTGAGLSRTGRALGGDLAIVTGAFAWARNRQIGHVPSSLEKPLSPENLSPEKLSASDAPLLAGDSNRWPGQPSPPWTGPPQRSGQFEVPPATAWCSWQQPGSKCKPCPTNETVVKLTSAVQAVRFLRKVVIAYYHGVSRSPAVRQHRRRITPRGCMIHWFGKIIKGIVTRHPTGLYDSSFTQSFVSRFARLLFASPSPYHWRFRPPARRPPFPATLEERQRRRTVSKEPIHAVVIGVFVAVQ